MQPFYVFAVVQTYLSMIIFEVCKIFMFFAHECKLVEVSYWKTQNAASQARYSYLE